MSECGLAADQYLNLIIITQYMAAEVIGVHVVEDVEAPAQIGEF